MTPENYIKSELIAFAAHEAGPGAGYDQMMAVACVLYNRRKRGWQGGNWIEILKHAPEVSSLQPRPRTFVDLSSSEIRRLLIEIDDLYMGAFRDDLTGFAGDDGRSPGLYYADALWQEYGQMSPWFQAKILNDPTNHPRIAQVGTLYIFS